MLLRVLFTLHLACASGLLAAETPSTDESAVRAAGAAYVEAFNRHDAQAVAALWSPEAIYMSRTSGEELVGRDAIEQEFATLFEQVPMLKLEASTDSLQFISPNIAVEHGTAQILRGDDETETTNYAAVYVRRDGQWLLDRVTEETIEVNARHDNLKQLDWIIGNWSQQIGEDTVVVECNWAKNNNFIALAFTLSNESEVRASGLQVIGWDANSGQIRSWLFDSEGGFVRGTWSKHEDRWFVQSVATLADGGSGSFAAVFRPIDDDSFAWQKINQIVDGEILPNLDEVVLIRQ